MSRVFARRVTSCSVWKWIPRHKTFWYVLWPLELATAHFDVWGSNERLTTALHFYAEGGVSYVICSVSKGLTFNFIIHNHLIQCKASDFDVASLETDADLNEKIFLRFASWHVDVLWSEDKFHVFITSALGRS